jgi:hypothetical protein
MVHCRKEALTLIDFLVPNRDAHRVDERYGDVTSASRLQCPTTMTLITKRRAPQHITRGDQRLRLALPNTWEKPMACPKCSSENQSSFNGEVAIHFPGLKGLNKPIVWVFPKLAVCLDCGFAQFAVPESETRLLKVGSAASMAA